MTRARYLLVRHTSNALLTTLAIGVVAGVIWLVTA